MRHHYKVWRSARNLLWRAAMARKLDELPVYHKAEAFEAAVTALLDRPAFGRNQRLRDQISAAIDSVLANMSEGFEQPTDRAMEKYLYTAKGSAAEVCRRLQSAHRRRYITTTECAACCAMGEEVGRMLGGWIRYLARCDWKDRGRHRLCESRDENA
jgi:four helix bundle protein